MTQITLDDFCIVATVRPMLPEYIVVNGDVRRPYRSIKYISKSGDVHEHMMKLQQDGLEVLSVKSYHGHDPEPGVELYDSTTSAQEETDNGSDAAETL